MKRIFFWCFAGFLLTQDVFATPKSDSILTFTGAGRAKFAWDRFAWANEDYTGKTSAQIGSEGKSLMLFDTDEGVERSLDKIAAGANHAFIRISRSGKWLMWNDIPNGKTYIHNISSQSTSAKVVLLDKATCAYWCARAFWIDPTSGVEYIYCLNNYAPTLYQGDAIYKIPLTATGTADLSKATKIVYQGGAKVDDVISLSADGKKLGAAFPWPDTYVLDVATGRLDYRHNGIFGCQSNLAPDNSYRFFHCESDHYGIQMFPTWPSTDNLFIDLSKNLAGNPTNNVTDFSAPRWSNNVQFFSNSYPMGDNGAIYEDPTIVAGQSAAFVKALKIYMIGSFVLEKFAADFKSIEKSIAIAQDVRYRQYGGDAWLSNGTGSVSVLPSVAVNFGRTPAKNILVNNGTAIISGLGDRDVVRISDARGRVVRTIAGKKSVVLDNKQLKSGVYLISCGNKESLITGKLTITK